MRNVSKKKSTLAQARSWATKRGLFGAQAFLKYVILSFAENLNRVSDEVVFKGGNLLWVYIGTPRATTDLDLATLNINSHTLAKELIQKACSVESKIQFSLLTFTEISLHDKLGAALTIGYKTEQGATNRFEVDMVYALATDCHDISSPVNPDVKIRSATIENIVADKIAACRRFESAAKTFQKSSLMQGVVAFLMSGFGTDGVQGLIKLREDGAKTIVAHPESCLFAFTPQAAIEAGAADDVLNPEDFAQALMQFRSRAAV